MKYHGESLWKWYLVLFSYPEIGIKLHTREESNNGIKSVKSRAHERHTADISMIDTVRECKKGALENIFFIFSPVFRANESIKYPSDYGAKDTDLA